MQSLLLCAESIGGIERSSCFSESFTKSVMILVVVNDTSICNCGWRWWSTWIACELILWYIVRHVTFVIYMWCWWYICDVDDIYVMLVIFVIYIFCMFGWDIKINKKRCFQSPWHSAKWLPGNMLCRVSRARHSAKVSCLPSVLTGHSANRLPLPSVLPVALGIVATFAECLSQRRSAKRRPLPSAWPWHSAKPLSRWRSPSQRLFFAKCQISTRQRLCWVPDKVHSAKRSLPINYLPSARQRSWIR